MDLSLLCKSEKVVRFAQLCGTTVVSGGSVSTSRMLRSNCG